MASQETLVAHLEALRSVLVRCLVALAVVFVPIFLLSPYVLDWFTRQMVVLGIDKLHYFAPMEVFILQMKISALLDCTVCAPFIAWNAWKFILPALYDNEKKFIRSIAWLTGLMFVAGVVFCLFVCFPLVMRFCLTFSRESLLPVFGVSNVVSLALWLSLAFGCMFQFPLVTYALIRFGIVRYEAVCHGRPYVVVGILVVAGILTPPDIVSQLVLAIPAYLLFETGLFAARRYRKK